MSQLLSENCIVFDIDADEKREVLMTLVTELYRAGRVTDIGKFYEDVLAREAIAPTFVGFDMGLPHGKTDNVLEASVCFGRTTRPVVWNEGSGETADLVILIAVPVLGVKSGGIIMKVVGITSCPSGVAHTYMAAEALKLAGQKLGIEVLIETQGGAGVVLVNDVALSGLDRFKGKKVIKMGVSDLIKKSDAIMIKIQDTFQ